MIKFNLLVRKLLENNTSGELLGSGPHAPEDNRPFEPGKMAIGARYKKTKKNNKSKQLFIPIHRRTPIESIYLKSK
jgi:hypothetical protein